MKVGFELRKIRVPLDHILPVRQIKDPQARFMRYKMIVASLKEVGLIEPLVIYPQKGCADKYLLLEGHLRHTALKEIGETEADCIVATDDECFTYNARINRVAPIQEYKMITRAVQNGVRPERIAAALNIPTSQIRATMTLLDGIHDEAVELLKDKAISPRSIRLLKKVNSVRQIEIVELMVSANNYTTGYAEALTLCTPKDQLVNPEEPKQKEGMKPEEIARMEAEMETLEQDLKVAEECYGENMLNLTLARGYIKKLLDNARIVRFLTANHSDLLAEFESIAATEAL